jgi:hypothetical protein
VSEARRSKPIEPMRSEASHHAEPTWLPCLASSNARRTAVPMATVKMNGVVFEALCFGDFHLGQQMKVTRPPGRDPAHIK